MLRNTGQDKGHASYRRWFMQPARGLRTRPDRPPAHEMPTSRAIMCISSLQVPPNRERRVVAGAGHVRPSGMWKSSNFGPFPTTTAMGDNPDRSSHCARVHGHTNVNMFSGETTYWMPRNDSPFFRTPKNLGRASVKRCDAMVLDVRASSRRF